MKESKTVWVIKRPDNKYFTERHRWSSDVRKAYQVPKGVAVDRSKLPLVKMHKGKIFTAIVTTSIKVVR